MSVYWRDEIREVKLCEICIINDTWEASTHTCEKCQLDICDNAANHTLDHDRIDNAS